MIGFRDHVLALYQEAFAAAMSLRELFLDARQENYPDSSNADLRTGLMVLTQKVAAFESALPPGTPSAKRLRSHLAWIKHWLEKKAPDKCVGDTYELLASDLPEQWNLFADWYTGASTVDAEFAAKVSPLLEIGEFDSALRKAWAVFKSGMTELFEIPQREDGTRLAGLVFGQNGHARDLLGGSSREAYLNLFNALYVLSRDEVMHNDIVVDPAYAEAILVIVGSALRHVKQATADRRPIT